MIELIKHRYKYLWVSVGFFLFSIIMLFTNLNLWIDMTGWSQTDYSYTKEINIPEISTKIKDLSLEYQYRHEGVSDYITSPVNIPELIRRICYFVEE